MSGAAQRQAFAPRHSRLSSPVGDEAHLLLESRSNAISRQATNRLRRRFRGLRMIVNVRLTVVVLDLFLGVVVVAVGQFGMVVLMSVPVGAMLELPIITAIMVMRHVPMVVRMRHGWVRVGGSFAIAFRCLVRHLGTS